MKNQAEGIQKALEAMVRLEVRSGLAGMNYPGAGPQAGLGGQTARGPVVDKRMLMEGQRLHGGSGVAGGPDRGTGADGCKNDVVDEHVLMDEDFRPLLAFDPNAPQLRIIPGLNR